MYGTIARMQPKAGKQAELVSLIADWNRQRKPKVPGAVAAYVLTPDDGSVEAQMIAVFADKSSYRANAADPEQDRWYQRMRDLLDSDPTWQDGAINEV